MRFIDADALKKEYLDKFWKACADDKEGSFDAIGTMTKIIDEAPTIAEEIIWFANSRVTNDVVERFGEKILDSVVREVIQDIGTTLYQEGAITIEKVEDRARQEMVLIGRVSVLKKEGKAE